MKRFLPALSLFCAIALPASAALQAGDAAPDFAAQASLAGKTFDFALKDALKKGPVVVYFYPSAYTQGCNIQAHLFAENIDRFKAAGASVIGVSLDSIARLKEFSADPDYCAGKLAVASDADGKIAKAYDLKVMEGRSGIKDSKGKDIDHGFAERTTFIVSPSGKILAAIGGIAPDKNVMDALDFVQKLRAGNTKPAP